MADEFLRSKLYEYVANSNLVLEAERDGRRRSEAGKGEVESLRGKVSYFKMGDRLGKSTTTFDSKLLKRSFEESDSSVTNVNKHFKSSAERNRAVGHYVPQSAETRIAFEELLVEIRNMVGDLPHDDMLNAATEVLTVLKSSNLPEKQKISEIGALVGQVISINKIASIANRINDLANASSIQPLQHANEEEMAVVFDDDDDHDGGMVDEEEEEEEGNEEGQEEPSGFGIKQDSGDNLENSALKSNTHQGASSKTQSIDAINIHEVDAYWLQGRLSKYYDDANVSSRVADEVLRIISERDERLCESQLVALLGFDKFDLIKILLRNRAALYYCIRLKRAQTVEETQLIENEMKEDVQHGGALILSMLQSKTMVGGKPTELPSHPATGGAENRGKSEVQFSQGSAAGAFPAPVGRVVNLDEYVFTDGGHLLSNPQCTLPEQSWRAQKKGYEEVHVPALKSVVPPGEKLVLVSDLPDWMQPVFDGMRSFNRVQSKLFNSALNASKNMLLCAPTGSGKTNVALLCMLGLISKHRDQHSGLIRTKDFKIVYVAPMKALVQECVQTFGKKLSPLGINVRELSGDQSMSRQEIVDTQVIVTTPEKWDVITRKVAERSFLQLVKLVIIDEVHLLHDDRGPVLEALVARIIRNAESTISPVRIVGLSATLPNYKDVAAFLRVDQDDLHFFDNSYRPVPLQQQYIGVMEKKSLKRMQLMNEICYEKVLLHGTKNQVLIFTHSRADTVKTAKAIRDLASSNDTLSRFLQEGSASSEILKVESANAKNQDLKELLMCGFAVHHAGLSRSDRTLVEDLFADKHIKVLVSTATLAWGVNLPCRTVIIKGTQMYSPNLGRWTELSPLDILQMMGRAGRFGLDSEGEGIIITEHSELQYYLSLMNQQLPIESHMISKLPDLLNAEIVLGTISSLSEAVEWLGYTYLFVRMLRKPNLYGTSEEELRSDPSCLRIRGEFAHAAVSILEKHGLLRYDRRTGNISPTSLGKIASYYYLTSESASLYNETLRPSMTEVELFRLFSLSAEFKQVHVRDEEKLELRSLLQRVPVPVKESVDEPSAKVNVLLQAYISRLRLDVS